MGEVADAVGIQFRLLNTSRGPAVWSPRAQMDKKMYRVRMREVLEQEPNLRIKQAEVASLRIEGGRVIGVNLRDGRSLDAGAVIVTTGTFLNGLAHVGEMKYSCGRNGEAPSELLGDQLRSLGTRLDPSEDGHAAAAGRAHHRLEQVRSRSRAMPIRRHSRSSREGSSGSRFTATSDTPMSRLAGFCRMQSRARLCTAARSKA